MDNQNNPGGTTPSEPTTSGMPPVSEPTAPVSEPTPVSEPAAPVTEPAPMPEPAAPAPEPVMPEPTAPVSEPTAPVSDPTQSQQEEKCVTCGGPAKGGVCIACGKGEITCTCQPVQPQGGQGETSGGAAAV